MMKFQFLLYLFCVLFCGKSYEINIGPMFLCVLYKVHASSLRDYFHIICSVLLILIPSLKSIHGLWSTLFSIIMFSCDPLGM